MARIPLTRWLAALLALAIVGAACTNDPLDERLGDDGDRLSEDSAPTTPPTTAPLPPLDLAVRPGPFQLTIDEVPPSIASGSMLAAADATGSLLATATVADGSALLRDLTPGEVVVQLLDDGGEPVAATPPIVVPGSGPVDEAIYGDHSYNTTQLDGGFTYIPTRDGTLLSAFVTLPGSADGGPYPTLVEYSGYEPSRPGGDDPGRLVTSALGYALVQVNVRGTGCSGGSFDAFEAIQGVDGYDVIETVAAQPWAGKVGMYGVSYPGIMQLQVAANQPPSLAAIAPMAVLDDVGSVLFPGGIYNDGFGESWTRRVSQGAEAFGQGWEQDRVDGGDEICRTNQQLRVHNPDLVEMIQASPFTSDLTRARSPIGYAGDIEVPVFLAGAWQDEQTGGRWPALIEHLSAVPSLRVVMYNGLHGDAVAPELLAAVTEFYDLHLDDPAPGADAFTTIAIGAGLASFYGEILPISFNGFDPADADDLRQAYAEEPPIRVLFELGAGRPNLPVSSFSASFDQWPPAEAAPTRFAISGGGGGLALGEPGGAEATAPSSATFVTDPADGDLTTTDSEARSYSSDPDWSWPRAGAANRIEITSDALTGDLVVVGPASADLWVSADAPDADIEVTISEVAPDGSETYVQNGWLRLSRRAIDEAAATELRPVITGEAADVAELEPGGDPVLAWVEILPFAHVFRAGSRVRLTVDTPGASRPQWRFDVAPEPVTVTVHAGEATPSALVLPVLPGADAPTDRPPCGSLRAQPCRPG